MSSAIVAKASNPPRRAPSATHRVRKAGSRNTLLTAPEAFASSPEVHPSPRRKPARSWGVPRAIVLSFTGKTAMSGMTGLIVRTLESASMRRLTQGSERH